MALEPDERALLEDIRAKLTLQSGEINGLRADVRFAKDELLHQSNRISRSHLVLETAVDILRKIYRQTFRSESYLLKDINKELDDMNGNGHDPDEDPEMAELRKHAK